MDRYLCKAKRLDNAEWETGFYVKCRGHHYILPVYDDDHGYDERYAEWIEIDPKTTCQYTGMQDNNVRKIWENDIIEFEDCGEEGYEYKEGFDFTNKAKIVWKNGRYELDNFLSTNSGVVYDMNNNDHEAFALVFKDCEIIGNIFDNPDLLHQLN